MSLKSCMAGFIVAEHEKTAKWQTPAYLVNLS